MYSSSCYIYSVFFLSSKLMLKSMMKDYTWNIKHLRLKNEDNFQSVHNVFLWSSPFGSLDWTFSHAEKSVGRGKRPRRNQTAAVAT